MESLERIKEVVEHILEKDDRARNDDNWLCFLVASHYTKKFYINCFDIGKLPFSFETVTRWRRHIQNKEGRFLPSPLIENRRVAQEAVYENTFSRGMRS